MNMLREGNIDERSTYRKAMTLFDRQIILIAESIFLLNANHLLNRDPRWKAVEREKDREDLFDDYIWDLETFRKVLFLRYL